MREGVCTGCSHRTLVNLAVRNDKYLGEFCADCYDRLNLEERPRKIARPARIVFRPTRDEITRTVDEE